MNLDGSYPDGLYDSERIKAELQGQERPEDLVKSPVYLNQALNEFITMQRDGAWGNDTYREAGNTAIIRLDSFMPDEEAWDLYYKGEGDFPFIIQEAGAALIGEPSSGGSCCVQVGTDAEGFSYMMSSGQWQLTDADGVDVEGGCRIDIPIEAKSNRIVKSVLGFFGVDEGLPNYEKYFDDAYLSQLMNDYFQAEAEAETEVVTAVETETEEFLAA